MTNSTLNGESKVRKSLADQLDRFDQMLAGFETAIPEVVALTIQQATTQVVREAVQAALTEVLSNPEVLARLQGAPSPVPATPAPTQPEPPKPPLRERLGQL